VSAFEVVLVIVVGVTVVIGAASYFRRRSAVSQLGESPEAFAHPEDRPLSEQPSEDERDAPLPKRPYRARE
jgi:hypothetical protein